MKKQRLGYIRARAGFRYGNGSLPSPYCIPTIASSLWLDISFTLKICRVELCTELFFAIIPTLYGFYAFFWSAIPTSRYIFKVFYSCFLVLYPFKTKPCEKTMGWCTAWYNASVSCKNHCERVTQVWTSPSKEERKTFWQHLNVFWFTIIERFFIIIILYCVSALSLQ